MEMPSRKSDTWVWSLEERSAEIHLGDINMEVVFKA